MTKKDGTSGPLGELLAKLPQVPKDAPREAVHTRVLPVATTDGAELVYACWRDPGGPRALHSALRARIEGSLIGELSRTADDLTETPSALSGLRLFLFEDVPDADEAVKAFGLARAEGLDASARTALARLRHEADTFGERIPDEPHAVYVAKTASNDLAARTEAALIGATDDVWGQHPCAPFARLRQAFAVGGGPPLTADLAGLEAAEAALFVKENMVLRWLGPLTFQALCDLVAVAIDRDIGRQVHWAETTPDDDGVSPPPMIRIDGEIHVPIALEVLRWCVMPRRTGEQIPPLSKWVSESFG